MEKSHGGKRTGAGRKPASDTKIEVRIYIENSIIERNGGLQTAKDLCIFALKKKKK